MGNDYNFSQLPRDGSRKEGRGNHLIQMGRNVKKCQKDGIHPLNFWTKQKKVSSIWKIFESPPHGKFWRILPDSLHFHFFPIQIRSTPLH